MQFWFHFLNFQKWKLYEVFVELKTLEELNRDKRRAYVPLTHIFSPSPSPSLQLCPLRPIDMKVSLCCF